jgi:light-regulated signal transduction histidine kinase (bacteriophytochrome)
MEKIINYLMKTMPYPYLDRKGKITSRKNVSIPIQCTTCLRYCNNFFVNDESEKLKTCLNGFNVYKAEFNNYELILAGLLLKGKHGKLPRKKKKANENVIIELKDLEDWESDTTSLLKDIEEYKEFCVKESIAVYHDITPTISLIFRTLEAMIADVQGNTFDEKVDNSDEKHKTLYHAINLLDNRLKMMPLISNPEAAKFGQLTRCSPYKLFDKVCRLFNEPANTKGITIDLQSSGYKYITVEPLVYDSFITIPFVLVENAIKYSVIKGKVHIKFTQKGNSVTVSVTSFGPTVTTEDSNRIFEKGFKDPNAKKFASQGSGIGLYLANLVAVAHNFEILYRKGNIKMEKDIELGSNTFSFELKE